MRIHSALFIDISLDGYGSISTWAFSTNDVFTEEELTNTEKRKWIIGLPFFKDNLSGIWKMAIHGSFSQELYQPYWCVCDNVCSNLSECSDSSPYCFHA